LLLQKISPALWAEDPTSGVRTSPVVLRFAQNRPKLSLEAPTSGVKNSGNIWHL